MRTRPSARLLVLDSLGRVLLFRFSHARGPLAGQTFWATPGGALDPGETFEAAAILELAEETGLRVASVGPDVARREFLMQLPDGETVQAVERFFVVRTQGLAISDAQWTALEREVMTEHRWWSIEALEQSAEQVWPENLAALLRRVGHQTACASGSADGRTL